MLRPNIFRTADLYWQTARHLKLAQILGRVRFRMVRPRPDISPAPPVRRMDGSFQRPARRRAVMTGARCFQFLGETGHLDKDGWDSPHRTKLWQYNLHYFDDLNAARRAERSVRHSDLIADWIAHNPPGLGVGWEPYPTSLRIVNWVKRALAGYALSDAARHSLAVQARWLMRRLEWHLLGNHLFANAKALFFAGLYFEGPEGAAFRAKGTRILERELAEQILPDGGQFERSPMYHALALEDMLDLVNLLGAYKTALSPCEVALAEACNAHVPAMQSWLETMSHPDGGIGFFNDAAFGVAADNTELFAYATRLGIARPPISHPAIHLADSGYGRLAVGPAVLIADMAPVGPDYLPGHAHADTLSFELSVFGQRLLVNSGTSVYGSGTERLRQRGTSAHNTVTVAGQNSTEVWGGFRVARRARVGSASVVDTEGTLVARASHDGYRRLPGSPAHARTWQLSPTSLTVKDIVRPAHPAVARFHLHPDTIAEQSSPRKGAVSLAGGQKIRWQAEAASVSLEPSTWHPCFGESRASQCLVLTLAAGMSSLALSWD